MLFMKGKASSSHGSCHIVSHLSKYQIGTAFPKPGPSAFKLARRFDRSQRIASEFRPLHKTEKRQKNVTLSLVQGRGTKLVLGMRAMSFLLHNNPARRTKILKWAVMCANIARNRENKQIVAVASHPSWFGVYVVFLILIRSPHLCLRPPDLR